MMNKIIWERMIPLKKADESFDLIFWQEQSSDMRFRVTFDMLKDFYRLKKGKINAPSFRLQRSIENIKQARG
ncbi:MAG: hypothetical protein HY920_07125 [Elusimicrobia bacterium]|nr:hypothetical protein [Elusimicrobiota bacterium]